MKVLGFLFVNKPLPFWTWTEQSKACSTEIKWKAKSRPSDSASQFHGNKYDNVRKLLKSSHLQNLGQKLTEKLGIFIIWAWKTSNVDSKERGREDYGIQICLADLILSKRTLGLQRMEKDWTERQKKMYFVGLEIN